MRKVAEKKKKEIDEDRIWRAEQEEKEKQRKEKEKGKEVVSEAGPSSPQKRKAMEEPGNTVAKRPKVSNILFFGVILTSCSSTRRNITISRRILRLARVALSMGGLVSISPERSGRRPLVSPATSKRFLVTLVLRRKLSRNRRFGRS